MIVQRTVRFVFSLAFIGSAIAFPFFAARRMPGSGRGTYVAVFCISLLALACGVLLFWVGFRDAKPKCSRRSRVVFEE